MEQLFSIIITVALAALFSWLSKRNAENSKDAEEILQAEAALRREKRRYRPAPPIPTAPVQAPPVILPEEGVRVTDETTEAPQPAVRTGSTDGSRERWRRAIIDYEILTPKF